MTQEILRGGYTWKELQMGVFTASGRQIPKRTLEYWLSQLGIQTIKLSGCKQGRLYPETSLADVQFTAKQLKRGLTFSEIRQRLLEIRRHGETAVDLGTEPESISVQATPA